MKNIYGEYECPCCGAIIEDLDSAYYADDDWNRENPFCCEDCLIDGTTECDFCGDRLLNPYYAEDDRWEETPMCESCFDEHTYVCSCCEEHFLEMDDAYYTSADYCGENPICPGCADEETVICADCGDRIWREDAYSDDYNWYCSDCYYSRGIHEYDYKPEPDFKGSGPRYFGVELEVDEGGDDSDTASEVVSIAENDVYCKSDGSIHNGFEIVSEPCSLDYHKNCLNWEGIMDYLVREGYKSHDTETCGFHVHVSRKALGRSETEQEKTINKMILFLEKNRADVTRFTRRTPEKLKQWAAFYMDEDDTITVEKVAEKKDDSKRRYRRYHTVNLLNNNTVEFRLFRGTLKHNTFIGTLEFINLLVDTCLQKSESEIDNLSFEDFVGLIPENDEDGNGEYQELRQYLAERGLM